jgi:hypothetical protein
MHPHTHPLHLNRHVLTLHRPLDLILHVLVRFLCGVHISALSSGSDWWCFLCSLSINQCVHISCAALPPGSTSVLPPGSTLASMGPLGSTSGLLGGLSGLPGQHSLSLSSPGPLSPPLAASNTSVSALSQLPHPLVPSDLSGGSMGASGRHSSSPVVSTGSSDGLVGSTSHWASLWWPCDVLGALALVVDGWPGS